MHILMLLAEKHLFIKNTLKQALDYTPDGNNESDYPIYLQSESLPLYAHSGNDGIHLNVPSDNVVFVTKTYLKSYSSISFEIQFNGLSVNYEPVYPDRVVLVGIYYQLGLYGFVVKNGL